MVMRWSQVESMAYPIERNTATNASCTRHAQQPRAVHADELLGRRVPACNRTISAASGIGIGAASFIGASRKVAPMSLLRALLRIVAIGATTAVLYALFLLRRRARNAIVRAWARAVCRLLGMRSSVEGPLPSGRFFLVTNHLGYLDVLLLMQFVDVVFVANSGVREWPVIGRLTSSTGSIFVDRESRRDTVRVTGEMLRAVESGVGVVLFPEGTSGDGTKLLPFKSSLLEAAARGGIPVHAAAIRYRPAEVAWWDETAFTDHFWRVVQLPRIDASVRFGGSVTSGDRKELARMLEAEVRRLMVCPDRA